MDEASSRIDVSCLRVLFVMLAIALTGTPPIVSDSRVFEIPDLDDGPPLFDPDLLIFEQLPAATPVEERIAAYQGALDWQRHSGKDYPSAVPGFFAVAVDFSSLVGPPDALAAAVELAPRALTTEVFEELGVSLLVAARQARFSDELERAHRHLRAARYVFDLADRQATSDAVDAGDRGLVHRAMVGLEEVLVTDSRDAWPKTAELLARQVERTSSGPLADWAWRMLEVPATYVGEDDALLTQRYWANGDVRPPARIFTPQPDLTPRARKARLQGVVILQTVIDRHGKVVALKLLKGLPFGLSEETMRTVATWLFEPATLKGEPVVVHYNLAVPFRL